MRCACGRHRATVWFDHQAKVWKTSDHDPHPGMEPHHPGLREAPDGLTPPPTRRKSASAKRATPRVKDPAQNQPVGLSPEAVTASLLEDV